MTDEKTKIKKDIKSAVDVYNKIAEIYAEYTKPRLLQFQLSHFVSLLPSKGKILDAGSGVGRDSAYLKEDGLEVVSVDLSEGMIKEAKKLGVDTIKEDLLKIRY